MKLENAWTYYDSVDTNRLEELSSDYIDFLSEGKTERECTDLLVDMAKKAGYIDLNNVIAAGDTL